MKLATLVTSWDSDYEATLGDAVVDDTERRPFGKMLEGLHEIAQLRFQPYQNDTLPSFMEKLRQWLAQFDEADQPVAFLLAMKVIFVTQRQLEALGRHLFEQHIRRRLLENIILARNLPPYAFCSALGDLAREMDETLFIPNSDSSRINEFVHVNEGYFRERDRRRLTGPEVAYWIQPGVVATRDPMLVNKNRLVVLEDFSGTGSDLAKTLRKLDGSDIAVTEVIVGVLMATEKAMGELRVLCRELTGAGRRAYYIEASMILPESLRCFDGPVKSYLELDPSISGISRRVKLISEKIYQEKFTQLTPMLEERNMHGFGGLALAFAFYTNCPDSSLPIIWISSDGWRPLFQRVSRII